MFLVYAETYVSSLLYIVLQLCIRTLAIYSIVILTIFADVLYVLTAVDGSRQSTPIAVRDPLLHPELLRNRERQQAILKGLSALRQV